LCSLTHLVLFLAA